jgi:diacylglycerol kinase (ATP)
MNGAARTPSLTLRAQALASDPGLVITGANNTHRLDTDCAMPKSNPPGAMKSSTALNYRRVFLALTYSLQGLGAAWRGEPAFRQECGLFAVLAPITVWAHLPILGTMFLFVLMVLVLMMELMNSGLEALVDKTCPEYHALAGKAKDCASAAVLLALLAFVASWAALVGPELWHRLAN